ncbi:hypothetical protein [Streptococcus constellatus]|uniref:hypothetical protein n=1 Tax=Streptococcus constellatus TaxID=76860 RepID=UPI00217500AE|nr:hypothetical protein [Streptococcus constellatus]
MKKTKYRKYLIIATVVVALIFIVEGCFYYSAVDNLFFKFSLNFQNVIKAYKLDSDISQADAIKFLDENQNLYVAVITYIYCLAVIAAPFCTIGALIIFARTPYSYFMYLLKRKKSISFLILGKGENRDKFVKSLSKECKITLIEEEILQGDTKNSLREMGVSIIQIYQDEGYEKLLRKIHLDKFDYILLCDENVHTNYDYLKNIKKIQQDTNHPHNNSSHQTIYFTCNDPAFEKRIFQNDSQKNLDFRNVQLLNIQKKAVENMFEKYPIFQQSDGDCQTSDDVHIGIIGFDEIGQRILIEAISLSVLSADSTIIFDVFDKNMKSKIGIFLNNFHPDIINEVSYKDFEIIKGEKIKQYTLSLSSKDDPTESSRTFEVDGKMKIRFWDIDVDSVQFKKILSDCHLEDIFTYFVISTGNNHNKVGLLESIRKININSQSQEFKGQIIVFGQSLYLQDDVLFIEPEEDIFSYEAIRNEDILNQAKLFNYNYTCVQNTGNHLDSSLENSNNINVEWDKLELFHKESSIRQSMHQSTKRNYILAKKEFSDINNISVKEKLEKIEHRRWSLFMISSGYKWDATKDRSKQTHDCITNWEHLKKEQDVKILEYDFTPYIIILKESNNS